MSKIARPAARNWTGCVSPKPALSTLRDEEIPQRIAFVSDPVFEPSRAGRWWSGFWLSGARLGFAGAAMLSAALLIATFARIPSAGVSPSEVDSRIQRAVAASEARQTAKTTQLVHDLVQRVDTEHTLRVAAESDAEYAREQDLRRGPEERRLRDHWRPTEENAHETRDFSEFGRPGTGQRSISSHEEMATRRGQGWYGERRAGRRLRPSEHLKRR